MRYGNVYSGIFLSRPNRFIAFVSIDGQIERVHVKNTGRCAELLVPGNRVFLEKSDSPDRKTAYDLVMVEKQTEVGTKYVNMDSMAPNRMAAEWLASGGIGRLENLRAEVQEGDSRYDFAAEQDGRRVFIEVKGCTLEEDGIARFPDAPTLRGLKHVRGLTALAKEGCRCIVLIVIQMKGVRQFRPNWKTQPEFGEALLEAKDAGVEIMAVDCIVKPGEAHIDSPVIIILGKDL